MPVAPQDAMNSVVRHPSEPGVRTLGGAGGSNPHVTPANLRALEHIRRMRGGSQSHVMRCSDGNYYVVKFQNNPQHRRILVNEFLGTKLAALLGLQTTEIAIIEVTEGLIRLTPDLHIEIPWTADQWRIPCQSGLQFGSRYPQNTHHLTVLDFLPDKQLLNVRNLHDFVGMLVFDLWTCNTDGRQVIFGRQQIGTPYQGWMIDQGCCFNGGEWNFPDKPRRNLYDRKVVYEQVRGIETFEPWLAKVESDRIARALVDIVKTIPPEWYEFDPESIRRLLAQLDSRRSNVRELLWSARNANPLFFPNWINGLNQRAVRSLDRIAPTRLGVSQGAKTVGRFQNRGGHMTSKKRNGKKNILGASTKTRNRVDLANQPTRPRGELPIQPGLESLRSMLVKGRLGIFKLMKQLEGPGERQFAGHSAQIKRSTKLRCFSKY